MSGRRRRLVGTVVSNKMQKTVVVRVERLARHPRYERVMRLAKKFKAHDENQTARMGDLVEIEETKPMSKEKRWRLIEVLRRAPEAIAGDVTEPEPAQHPSKKLSAGKASAATALAGEASTAKASATDRA